MFAILSKDLSDYFNSLVAYITIGLFLLVTSLFLWVFPDSSILDYGYAGLDSLFNIAPYIFMFLIPAVTMRSFAEEKKEGTYELLATRPLSEWQILSGKFLASFCIVLLALIPTLIYYFTVYNLGTVSGNVDSGAVIGSYIGLLLLGAAFTSIGIFSSSISKNQIISFVIAVFLCFFAFSGFDSLSQVLSFQSQGSFLSSLGINQHYQSISRGVLDTRDLIYFISFIGFFLAVCHLILRGRKW